MKTKVICCDLDSTIADTRHRWHMIDNNPNPDWLAYALACEGDTPANIDVLWAAIACGYEIIFVSSRPEGARSSTLRWLNKLSIPYIALVLDEDSMDDLGQFKVNAIRQIDEIYDVVLHLDDLISVKNAVEYELGIYVKILSAYDD